MKISEPKSLNSEMTQLGDKACKEGGEVDAEEEEEKVDAEEEDGIQMGKVIDASLYGTDIMTDGIQFVHHRLNCHWRWAIGTATFMLVPAVVEAISLAFRWVTWMRKAWLVRLTVSCLFLTIFMTLCGLLASVAIPTENPVYRWTLRPLFVAFIMVLLFLFVKNIIKTLRGYSVLMLRRTNEDGTLPEVRMVDAVKGKLTEVVCEAAPQSVHQVYILFKGGIQSRLQVVSTAVSILCLIKGMSEAALFSLSGGVKIPSPKRVLLGMVPLAFDTFVRVVGQGLVLTYVPAGIFIVCLKYAVSFGLACPLKQPNEPFHQKAKTVVINGLAGLVSPTAFIQDSSIPREKLRKYFAVNRIVVNSMLLIELSVLLTITMIHKGEQYFVSSPVESGVPNWLTIPSNNISLVDCTHACPEHVVSNSTLSFDRSIFGRESFVLADHYKDCIDFVALKPSASIPLCMALIPCAIYTIIESLMMLWPKIWGVKTLSDRLLFDQGDLPDKVFTCCMGAIGKVTRRIKVV